MHPSISQRRAILEGLRARTLQATAEFYQRQNILPPALAPKFIVKPTGNNTFEVIERATSQVITQRVGHNSATGYARELGEKSKQFSASQLGQILRCGILCICLSLTLLALIGSNV